MGYWTIQCNSCRSCSFIWGCSTDLCSQYGSGTFAMRLPMLWHFWQIKKVALMTFFTVDYFHTLITEVRPVQPVVSLPTSLIGFWEQVNFLWSAPWTIIKVIFFISRYSPFLDGFIGIASRYQKYWWFDRPLADRGGSESGFAVSSPSVNVRFCWLSFARLQIWGYAYSCATASLVSTFGQVALGRYQHTVSADIIYFRYDSRWY